MEIAFILSLEHPTLPKAEIIAVLKAVNISFTIKKDFAGLLILEIPQTFLETLITAGKRLSLTHEIFQIIINTDNSHLMMEIEEIDWNNIILNDYAVRVKKMGLKSDVNTLELEKEIGGLIKDKLGSRAKINLENPDKFLRTVLINNFAFMGLRIVKISKKHFFEKKPHKRPFFYPGSMSPKLARCMVNLTRIKSNDRLLDPFCGTGGILIEAGIIGARVVGSDIDPKMVKGTIENLKHCEINDYEIFEADARKLKLAYQVDGIATDPPYGISASTRGSDSSELYEEALYSFEHLIKDEGLMCLATPHTMDIQNILEGTKFEIIEQYHIRMHKSLTRVISVLKKNNLETN
jgi:tRNA (guanine10-N2)-dimethyltransferase